MTNRHWQRRMFQPVCDSLESRELLNAAAVGKHHSAEIRAEKATTSKPVSVLQHLQTPPQAISTVPSNGDVNPYGVAFVPSGFASGGTIQSGDILVSNWNNKANVQGTGTTIVSITPQGTVSTFYQGPPGVGLDTALGVLKRGYVIVGSVPTTDGTFNTIKQGSILILDKSGKVFANLANPSLLNGPWDLTVDDRGKFASVFVSNVLSGTVSRFDLVLPLSGQNPITVIRAVQIGSGFPHGPNTGAVVVGPGGLAYDSKHDILYVASESDNSIYAISHAEQTHRDAGTGKLIVHDTTHLHGPMGLTLTPNGTLIVANSDAVNVDPNQPSELVEYTTKGQFLAQKSIDPANGGAFGLAISPFRQNRVLAAVDDNTPGLQVFTIA